MVGLWLVMQVATFILLLEETLHHLGCIKPYEYWDIYYINFCRISSINSLFFSFMDSWSSFHFGNVSCHFPSWICSGWTVKTESNWVLTSKQREKNIPLLKNIIWMFPKIVVPPNHPILIGFSIINHPFWGTPIFGNTHLNEKPPWLGSSHSRLSTLQRHV